MFVNVLLSHSYSVCNDNSENLLLNSTLNLLKRKSLCDNALLPPRWTKPLSQRGHDCMIEIVHYRLKATLIV